MESFPSMKSNLIFITGKGNNSKNNKPVLRPYIIKYLENNKYVWVIFV